MEISKIPTTVRNAQGWYEKSVVRTVRKIQGWYEKSMVRNVYGTKSPAIGFCTQLYKRCLFNSMQPTYHFPHQQPVCDEKKNTVKMALRYAAFPAN